MVSIALTAVVVTVSVLVGLYQPPSVAVVSAIFATLVALLIIYRQNFMAVRLTLLLMVCLLLLIRANQVRTPDSFDVAAFTGQRGFDVVVDAAPRRGTNSLQVISHNIVMSNTAGDTWHGGIALTLPRYTDVNYGDRIALEGRLKAVNEIEDVGYRNYLINHQVYATAFWPEIIDRQQGYGNPVVAAGIEVQNAANQALQELLPRDAASFIAGVVLGSEQELSEEFDAALKTTGTTHIIVASGYNISIILGMVLIIARKQRRSIKTLVALTIIFCYLVISGFDPSIIRASVMAALVLLVATLGRQRQAAYLLLLTAIIMLLIHPIWILDTGFQLSFAATLGIISLQPAIAHKINKLPDWLSEAISTTVSAQIFVLPIIAITFSTISVISLISNLLIVWVVPIIMMLGAVMLATSFVLQSAGQVVAFLIYPIFWYIKQTVHLTAQLPFASVPVNVSWVSGIIYYAMVLLLMFLKDAKDEQQA